MKAETLERVHTHTHTHTYSLVNKKMNNINKEDSDKTY